MLQLQDNEVGVYEPDGGVLAPEKAIETQLERATALGATIYFQTRVERWEQTEEGFSLSLRNGQVLTTRSLILSMGSWFKDTLAKIGVTLRIQRNVQAWFTPATKQYNAGRFPPFLLERQGLPAPLYGFPDFGDGVKAAFHSHGECSEPDQVNREIDLARDIEPIARAMDHWMPGAAGQFRAAKTCPYSLTPDGHFVVDRHPEYRQLILCGGFSGHGFKFAPVIGEIAADLALQNCTRYDIGFLSLRRFAKRDESNRS
jgi:glycine/D-amino acid oxidase-like deaminating enzyme